MPKAETPARLLRVVTDQGFASVSSCTAPPALIPVGRAVAGLVSETLGSKPVLMTGAVCTVIGCLSLLLVPSVRRLALQRPGREPEDPAEPVPASSPRTGTTEGRSA